jgi:hypothetical protein
MYVTIDVVAAAGKGGRSRLGPVRWEGLFADLEGQLAAEERRELDSEVAERTRRERALVDLTARLGGSLGRQVRVDLEGGRRVDGLLADHGDGWLLLTGAAGPGVPRETLVRVAGVVAFTGLGGGAEPARTARRFGLGYALRALSRDRATVGLLLAGGGELVGTVDVVGADHVALAEHPEGEPRRRENVRRVVTVPFTALLAVESRR